MYDRSFDRLGDIINNYGQGVSDMLRERARSRAEHSLRQQQAIQGGLQSVLGTISGAIQQDKAEKAQKNAAKDAAEKDAAFTAKLNSGTPLTIGDAVGIYGPEKGAAIYKAYSSLQSDKPDLKTVIPGFDALSPEGRAQAWPAVRGKMLQSGMPEETLPAEHNEEWYQKAATPFRPAAAGPTKLGKDDRLIGPDGKVIVDAAPAAPKPPGTHVVGGALVDDAGKVIYRDPNAGKGDKADYQWVLRNNEWIEVPRGGAQPGDRPASTREQGRPVTSGDAGRISDLKTSLDDLDVLKETLKGNKATGTTAKLGAMLPDSVTEFTGWGADAKSKQATIDRVKQVIGKALEEGVLRKEDEAKYEKILPTLSDAPSVAAHKIEGLVSAIRKRQQTFTESLTDAGFDTSKFEARRDGGIQTAPGSTWDSLKTRGATPPKKRNPFR